jgi:hypothetical protein
MYAACMEHIGDLQTKKPRPNMSIIFETYKVSGALP